MIGKRSKLEIPPDRKGNDFNREAMILLVRRHAVHPAPQPQID